MQQLQLMTVTLHPALLNISSIHTQMANHLEYELQIWTLYAKIDVDVTLINSLNLHFLGPPSNREGGGGGE